MTLRRIRAAPRLIVLAMVASLALASCGSGDGGATVTSARPSASAAPAKPPRAAEGAACDVSSGLLCAGGLTCVRGGDRAACLKLPVGKVCGVFQCKVLQACCDADANECIDPDQECAPRAAPGRRGSICRTGDPGGCDPHLDCGHAPPAPFGVCEER